MEWITVAIGIVALLNAAMAIVNSNWTAFAGWVVAMTQVYMILFKYIPMVEKCVGELQKTNFL